jgi:hypothetical protein
VRGGRIEDVRQPGSNPLRQELARGERAEPHPDEDVLNAFAENVLLERERGRVMEHLSVCAECREVLMLATDAMPEATVVQEKMYVLPVRPPSRTWMPWVGIAAGVLVVGSAVVVHERELEVRRQAAGKSVMMAMATPPPAPEQLQPTSNATAQQNEQRQAVVTPAVKGQPGQAAAARAMQGHADQAVTSAAQPEDFKKAPVTAAKSLKSMQSQYGGLPLDGVDRTAPAGGMEQKAVPQSQAPQPAAQTAATAQLNAVTGVASNGSVEVANAPPQIATQDDQLHGTSSARAKPSAAPAYSNAAQAPALAGVGAAGSLAGFSGRIARAHWRIDDAGRAERSLGNGAWRPVLSDESAKMRVVSVSGSSVWLGGENLRLYHSEDDGATWRLVPLPNKDTGAHAVTHIRFQGELAGTVDADDGTQWSTVDGGLIWK